ncbi:MAG: hypothetical protein LAT55_10550 [Opitutales bacterium]|nr:hypothetical protein [Opitutales bacterium]
MPLGAEIEEASAEGPAILPIAEIEPGMTGEWHTVVKGTEVEVFPLEILAIRPHHLGPNRPLIVAEALDEKNILSGPVSGMSGSPVFIDGKLIGAYAYGWAWSRDQAVIGITPIEQILEVWESPRERTAPSSQGQDWEKLLPPEVREDPYAHQRDDFFRSGGVLSQLTEFWRSRSPGSTEQLMPLQVPLSGGTGGGALTALLESFGFEVLDVPGAAGQMEEEWPLEAGSAVALVLLGGDFGWAGTGTVTWREGDQVLAFGHPWRNLGSVEVPMATARVDTVVRRFPSSFKLSTPGTIIGSITEDRLSTIAGKVGEFVDTTDLRMRLVNADGETLREASGPLFRSEMMAPGIAAGAILQFLERAMDFEARQTYRSRAVFRYEGVTDPLVYEDWAVGPDGPLQLAMGHMFRQSRLENNPFEELGLEALEFEIKTVAGEESLRLREVFIENKEASPGDTVHLRLRVRNIRGEEEMLRYALSLPEGLRSGDRVELVVGDAREAHRADPRREASIHRLGQFLDAERRWRANNSIYFLLVKEDSGYEVKGESLHQLPASVRTEFHRSREGTLHRPLSRRLLKEENLALSGEFRGSFQTTLTIK